MDISLYGLFMHVGIFNGCSSYWLSSRGKWLWFNLVVLALVKILDVALACINFHSALSFHPKFVLA